MLSRILALCTAEVCIASHVIFRDKPKNFSFFLNMSEDVRYATTLFLKVFATCSPPLTAVLFMGMTAAYTPQERWKTGCKGLGIASIILALALVFGNSLLEIIGVSMQAFQVAAGLLLGKLGWDMVHADCFEGNHVSSSSSREDISVTPLGFPTIVGPGAISSIIIGKADAVNTLQHAYAYVVGSLIMLSFFGCFYVACFCSKWLRPAFIVIFTKLTGLVVLTIAAQFILTGTLNFFTKT